jgi:hypothetical protein
VIQYEDLINPQNSESLWLQKFPLIRGQMIQESDESSDFNDQSHKGPEG